MSVLFPKNNNKYLEWQTGKRIKGVVINTYATNLQDFTGNVQPMNQQEIDNLDIGRKELGKIKAYTDKQFNISEDDTNKKGDLIYYDNKYYEIIGLDHHTGSLLPHRKYIAEFRRTIE